VSDTTAVNGNSAKKSGARPALAALVLVVAIAAFAAAFWYVGGLDYVSGVVGVDLAAMLGLGSSGAPGGLPGSVPATSTPSTSATGTASAGKPTDVPDALAKRMYIEQIESAPQIERLASGKTTAFTIDKVETKSPTETWIAITVDFTTEPKVMKGVMALSKAGANWYFLWIQDLTGAAKTAEGLLTTPKLTEPTEPTAEEYDEAGITTVDQAIIDAVLTSQAANQALVAGLVDGTYTSIALTAPVTGPGTLTIPVTATGPKAAATQGSVTLITKRIDGKDRTFVASFKKQ
jgi:ABC-type amino acid transport substrate-binding protein